MNPVRAPGATREPGPVHPPVAASRPTGIAVLDQALGPLSPAARVLFEIEGADAAPFLQHAAATHAQGGGRVLYVTPRSQEEVRLEARRLGFAEGTDSGRLTVAAPPDATSTAAAQRIGPDDLLVLEPGAVAAGNDGLRLALGHKGPVFAALPAREPVPDLRAHGVVRLRRSEVQGVRVDTFQVTRRPSGASAPRAVPYRVDRPGGVRPHVAKILVTGPHNAGKSSFVHALSQTGVSVELLGTTVALDHGQVERDGILVDVFGTPGQERFDPVIRQVAQGAQGVIVVVDSDRPSTFVRARTLARETSGDAVPVVWAANKQDAPGALGPEALRRALGLEPHVVLVPCVATEFRQAARVLDALLALVMAPPAGAAT